MTLEVVHTKGLGNDRRDQATYLHIKNWLKNPDKGSNFDRKTWFRHYLPTAFIIWVLFRIGYEGLVFFNEDGRIVGHVFFQKHGLFRRHGKSYHVFHWFIEPEERGQKYLQQISDAFFEYARENPAISKVRIGAGGHERIARLWESIRDDKIHPACGLRACDEMGWLFFPERVTH